MNDVFERRVRAAAVAGWWTLLIAVIFLSVVWFAYLGIMAARPAWMLTLWGPDVSWVFIQNVAIWSVAIFKIVVWLMALIVIWLTLWARRLRKSVGGA